MKYIKFKVFLFILPLLVIADPYPIEYWAVRDGVANFNISSDGTYVSYQFIESKRSDPVIHILKTNNLEESPKVIGADKMEVTSHYWVDDTRMIVSFRQKTRENIKGFNQGIYSYKLALLDLDTNKFTELDKVNRTDSAKSSIMRFENSLPKRQDEILVGIAESSRKSGISPYSYYTLNLKTFKRKLVLKGNSKYGNISFTNDAKPLTAASFNRPTAEYVYYFRDYDDIENEDDNGRWVEYFRIHEDSYEDFRLLAPVTDDELEWDEKSVYVIAQNGRDKAGVWTYDIDDKKFVKLIFEDSRVDVSGGVYHYDSVERENKLVGFSTFEDKLKRYYFQGDISLEVEALYYQLEQIIPNPYNIRIVSSTAGSKSFIVRNVGPKDPGTYYLYHNQKFEKLSNAKPFLEPEKLADLSYITYPSSDGTEISAYVHTPNGNGPFPLVVVPHGGPFVSEKVVYDSVGQFLANNGYMVVQPQYRGSFNYGLDFHKKAFIDGGQGGRLMQDDKDYAAKYLIKNGRADADNVFMWGGSYGGYAALHAATNPLYKCSIGFAVVSDMKQQLSYYANRMSGSQEERQKAYRIDSISPIDIVDQVKIPLLIIHGDKDQRTPIKHAYRYVDELKKLNKDHKFVELKGADHFFSSMTYDHFTTLYQETLDFLDTCGSD